MNLLHAVAVCMAAWVLFGAGFEVLFSWTGKPILEDHLITRSLVFACAAVYFVRVGFGTVVMFQRKIGYGEAFRIGFYVVFIHTLYAYFGFTNVKPFGWPTSIGLFLYIFGSFLMCCDPFLSLLIRHRALDFPPC